MKILSNKRYEYLMKCETFYKKWVESYKKAGKTESARKARAKYYKSHKAKWAEYNAIKYRKSHPNAKPYKPKGK